MFTETVSPEFAAQLEFCEVRAWLDMYAAAPADFARQFELEIMLSVRFFVGDIEAPTPQMNTPAYRNFEGLGFKRPYFRSHYSY